jgi:hypothetical protein
MVLLFIIASAGFASSNVKTANSPTGIPQVKNICIELGDITNMTECELTQLINESFDASLGAIPEKQLQCSVTLSAKVKTPLADIDISVTVSGDCSEMRAAGTRMAKQIIAEIKAYLLD